MNNPLCFIILLLIITSCDKKETESSVIKPTEINLNFTDYNPKEHKSFIDLTIENSINPIKKQLKISDSGKVSYNFINLNKKELVFDYENRKFSIVISPNEKININLRVTELLERVNLKTFTVSGINKKTNELILSNTFLIDSLIKKSSNFTTQDTTLNDIRYKNRRISEIKNNISTLKNYYSENKISDKIFINWSFAKIRYNAGNDLSIFPFFGKTNYEINEESPYFKFIEELDSFEKDKLTYQSKLNYLKTLKTSFKIMSNISNKYDIQRNQLKKDSVSNFPIEVEMIKSIKDKSKREIVLAFAFQKNQKVPKVYQDSLRYFVNKDLLSKLKEKKEKNSKSIKYLIKNYNISKKEKDELLEIYQNTSGKVIFHDFWFTNCAPCMKELPNYNNLMAKAGKDVVFIMFGAYMNEIDWKKTIDKFNLKGKHHLLTKNQLAFYEFYFGVHGFPHHQIINSKGLIIEEQIPGVYPTNFEKIIEQIKKHK